MERLLLYRHFLLVLIACLLILPPVASDAQGQESPVVRVKAGDLQVVEVDGTLVDGLPIESMDPKIATGQRHSNSMLRIIGGTTGETKVIAYVEKDGVRKIQVIDVQVEGTTSTSIASTFVREWEDDLRGGLLRLMVSNLPNTVILTGEFVRGTNEEITYTQIKESGKEQKITVQDRAKPVTPRASDPINVGVVTTLYLVSDDDMKNLGFEYNGIAWSAEAGANAGSSYRSGSGSSNFTNVTGGITATTGGRVNYQQVLGNAERLDTQTILTTLDSNARKLFGGETNLRIATDNTVGIQKVEFGSIVNVTPRAHPNSKDHCILEITVESSTPLPGRGEDFTLQKDSTTQRVVLRYGEQRILANTFQRFRNKEVQRVPGLGQIPLIGNLFKNRSYMDGKAEVLLVVQVNKEESDEVITLSPDRLQNMREFENQPIRTTIDRN
jgi:Flp pilus assembly secretin CpaC